MQAKAESTSKIPLVVGAQHNRLGNWLTAAVACIALLGLAHPIIKHILTNQLASREPFQVLFIGLMFALTIASLVFLYRAKQRLWRGVFATLTGAEIRTTVCSPRYILRTSNVFSIG